MYQEREDLFYYITIYNEDYPMPEMPVGSREGIIKGIYKYKAASGAAATVQLFGSGPIIAASDYMKVVPDQLSPWLSTRLVTLGTDGFGRSDNREHLRRHFEVNAESIAGAALSRLARDGKFDVDRARKAFDE